MTSHYIIPKSKGPFGEQLNSCIDQIEKYSILTASEYGNLVFNTFFISASNQQEFYERSDLIFRIMIARFGNRQAATNIIAQDTGKGMELIIELFFRKPAPGTKVYYKKASGFSYCVVEKDLYKEIYGGVATKDLKFSVRESAFSAFSSMKSILKKEGLHMGNIVRQWNYIERISNQGKNDSSGQNYQDFNDIRTKFYDEVIFKNGYPAATGIGVNHGGVAIAFIAISESEMVRIRPLRNLRQTNAYQYSEEVLKAGSNHGTGKKTTPKFERGTLVSFIDLNYLFVSGTAAIEGEKSLFPGDVKKQTIATIENIYYIFSNENQECYGLDLDAENILFSHLRVYVKHKEDIPAVKTICQSMLKSHSTLYLVSDICREELLVEIEGITIMEENTYTGL